MPRKDMHNIRPRTVYRNGHPTTVYQVRVSLKDEHGITSTYTGTRDKLKDAQAFRDRKRLAARDGELGVKREKQREYASITVAHLHTPMYEEHIKSSTRPSDKEEFKMIGRILKWAPSLGKKSITDTDGIQEVYSEYRQGRLRGEFARGPITKYMANRELAAIRSMFKWARERYRYKIDPFQGFKSLEEEKPRERILKPGEAIKLYKAIEDQCRTKLLYLRWLSLVLLALSTALRRGVLFHIKWEDVDFENKMLTIKPSYWNGKKRAPPEVPLSNSVLSNLISYYDMLPEPERTPTSRLFPGTVSGYNSTEQRIIERSGLEGFQLFRDLRATAVSRYAHLKPIKLSPRENSYLLGHLGGMTGRYERAHEELVASIRVALDAAEKAYDPLDISKAWKKVVLSDGTELAALTPEHIASLKASDPDFEFNFPQEWELWEATELSALKQA